VLHRALDWKLLEDPTVDVCVDECRWEFKLVGGNKKKVIEPYQLVLLEEAIGVLYYSPRHCMQVMPDSQTDYFSEHGISMRAG
jgi:hypothetical protein